jgi:hypothetical protein
MKQEPMPSVDAALKLLPGLSIRIEAREDVADEVVVGVVEHAPERRFQVGGQRQRLS